MKMNERDRQILHIALPAIVTNITVPLLGLVDTAIVGHMGDAVYMAAVAVGSMIFNLIYWIFGFLRMGTSGLTAQARGRRDLKAIRQLLQQSLRIALGTAVLLLLLQWPLRWLMMELIHPTADVLPLATTYFYIVIWGAPAMLALYALSGWYIGMQNTRLPMVISIVQNVVNIVASLLLVYGLGMKIEGVALGTVVAQYAGFFMAVGLLWHYYRRLWQRQVSVAEPPTAEKPWPAVSPLAEAGKAEAAVSMKAFLAINRDIFLRTLCLVAVNLFFTSFGARQGATILAVNTLLMQLYLLFSYIMDGFAYAGEALGGRFWGARHATAFREVTQRLFGWGALMTIVFTTIYVVGGMPFLELLTDEPNIVAAAHDYVWWAYLIPASGVAAFIWDGIFIGTTQTRGMLLSATIATAGFFLCALTLTESMGNHGLWLAMTIFLALRGIVQTGWFATRLQKMPL